MGRWAEKLVGLLEWGPALVRCRIGKAFGGRSCSEFPIKKAPPPPQSNAELW